MEPVVATAIISGIGSGAAAAGIQTTASAIGAMFVSLKDLLVKKYGNDNELLEAVKGLEKDADSPSRQGLVREKAEKIGADSDQEIQAAARQLLELLKEVQPEAVYNATLNGPGAIAQGGSVAAGVGGVAIGGNMQSGIKMPGSKDG